MIIYNKINIVSYNLSLLCSEVDVDLLILVVEQLAVMDENESDDCFKCNLTDTNAPLQTISKKGFDGLLALLTKAGDQSACLKRLKAAWEKKRAFLHKDCRRDIHNLGKRPSTEPPRE